MVLTNWKLKLMFGATNMIQTCMETGTLRYVGFLFLHTVKLFFHADDCHIWLSYKVLHNLKLQHLLPGNCDFELFSTN